MGAPGIDVTSLKSDMDNAMATMQSKDLDLNQINKQKNRQSRYEQMDSDEKTMLKSAISKVASNKDY